MAKIVLTVDDEGNIEPVELQTDEMHELILPTRSVELERLYHDDDPVRNAAYELELAGGRVVTGKLDERGRATVHVLGKALRVRFGPDTREWQRVDSDTNPAYREAVTSADIEALVTHRLVQP